MIHIEDALLGAVSATASVVGSKGSRTLTVVVDQHSSVNQVAILLFVLIQYLLLLMLSLDLAKYVLH